MAARTRSSGSSASSACGVAFFGYGELGLAGLETLVHAGASVTGVIVPSNRAGAEVNLLREAARRHHLALLVQPPRGDTYAFAETLRSHRPAVIIVWSYSMILSPAILKVPAHGAVNVHGGLLPEYRGGHVMQWALITGEPEFGVTLHYMDAGIDTGPVIAQERFAVHARDDARTLRAKIRTAGSALLAHWWPRLVDGTAPRVPQDPARATYWPMRTPEQGRIHWAMSAEAICRLVRALTCNSPGAYVEVGSRRVSIRGAESRPALTAGVEPGHVVAVDTSGIRVSSGEGDVLILAAELDGTPISVAALARLMA